MGAPRGRDGSDEEDSTAGREETETDVSGERRGDPNRRTVRDNRGECASEWARRGGRQAVGLDA